MGRAASIVAGLAALALCVLAMIWSAMPPMAGPARAVVAPLADAAHRVVAWYRSGPADGHPDWDAAAREVFGGDAGIGADLIALHGCGACHAVPGITGANGSVGPSLEGFARRSYVAGILPNEPGGLTRWLVDPPAHAPDTAMPDLGLTEEEARHIAAFLYGQGGG